MPFEIAADINALPNIWTTPALSTHDLDIGVHHTLQLANSINTALSKVFSLVSCARDASGLGLILTSIHTNCPVASDINSYAI